MRSHVSENPPIGLSRADDQTIEETVNGPLHIKFSFVIPTYNEEHDVAETLEALLAIDYPDKEIIVVDDSTDSTPEIVRSYSEKGVLLFRPEKRAGRCEARNIGIREATGDVVVILNADVRLKADFLNRLFLHYEQGYDYVLVRSKVSNTESLWARYVGSRSEWEYAVDPSANEWTEGFSCRKRVAIEAGLFPSGFPIQICAGEDRVFGGNLRKAGAKMKLDLSIMVEHLAPDSFRTYWQIRKERLKGGPQVRFFVEGWSLGMLVGWAILRIAQSAALVLPLVPLILIARKTCRYSPYGGEDTLPFMWAWLVERTAFHVGEWEGIMEIARVQRRKRKSECL